MKSDHSIISLNSIPNGNLNSRNYRHVSVGMDKHFSDSPNQTNFPIRIPKEEPLDYSYGQTYDGQYKKSMYERTRIIHNSSHVSDNASVIPWRETPRYEQDGVCDSSTSPQPQNHSVFAVPHEPKKHDKYDLPIRPTHQITPAEFLAMSRGPAKDSRPLSTTTSLRSTVLDIQSRNSSGFSNPRHSARGKKRMLSASPLSTDFIDNTQILNEIIRTSPSSLVAYVNNNDIRSGFASRGSGRNSSAASMASHGSFGHLSASSSSPSYRQRNAFQTPSRLETPPSGTYNSKKRLNLMQSPQNMQPNMAAINSSISKGFSPPIDKRQGTVQEEVPFLIPDSLEKPSSSDEVVGKHLHQEPAESSDEENTNENPNQCMWKNCGAIFETQAALVQHVNTDHIQKNKKDCTCYWEDCTREEKPFKAMYMLVVHVRRHTGEKPHKCNFTGCTKAYSRLENLKTHVRSHTGERPYVCEIPGCTKAFSNASDRAKHQNRTHSSIKQYGCKVEGCTKRYTDPSSLRKHMKTVHNALPQQPNKKFKSSNSDNRCKDTKQVEIKQEDDAQGSPKNRESCSAKPSNNYYLNSQSEQGSPSYPINNNSSSNSPGRISSRYTTGGFYGGGGASQSNGNNYSYGGAPRMWSNENNVGATTAAVNDASIDIRNNLSISAPSNFPNQIGDVNQLGPNLVLQTQSAIEAYPRIHKPIEPQPVDIIRRQSNNQLNKINDIRRGSNASTGSNDSGLEIVYNGSRRGSNISDLSAASGGRVSVTMASPLPTQTLSPRCFEPTVIEGEILENYEISNSPKTNLGDNGIVGNDQQASNNSRMSSGYGSQNLYFPSKNRARASPLPSCTVGPRRASDGNVQRVSDAGFSKLQHMKSRMMSRRGSEPTKTTTIIDNTPRRHSLSNFKTLPVPSNMQKSLSMEDPSMISVTSASSMMSITTAPNIVQAPYSSAHNDTTNSAGMLQMMTQANYQNQIQQHQNLQRLQNQNQRLQHLQQRPQQIPQLPQHHQQRPLQQHQQHQQQQLPFSTSNLIVQHQNGLHTIPHPPTVSKTTNVMKAPADSTINDIHMEPSNHNYNDPLEEFVESYPVNQDQFMPPDRLSHQPIEHSLPMQNIAPSQYMPNQNFNELPTSVNTVGRLNHLPDFQAMSSSVPSFLHPSDSIGQNNMTLQWRNNHFSPKHVEPDSTTDKDLEDLMIQGLGALTTEPIQNQNMSNMTINTMDTLMTSFAEENKYFENQAFQRFP